MNTRKQIVCILGNSVSLLVQPFRKNSNEKTYSEHLSNSGYEVINSSKQSTILSDIYKYLEDECIRKFPDYVIINYGIVDCSYRVRTRWIQNYFNMNAWNNSVINKGYRGPINRGIVMFVKKIYKIFIEKLFHVIGLKRRWLGPKDFNFILIDIIKRMFQDTPVKKIILIGMLPLKNWVEKIIPGTQGSIIEYNEIIKSVSKLDDNIIYINPSSISDIDSCDDITYDGIHFNALGHKKLANKLISVMYGERKNYINWEKINQYNSLLFNLYKKFIKK